MIEYPFSRQWTRSSSFWVGISVGDCSSKELFIRRKYKNVISLCFKLDVLFMSFANQLFRLLSFHRHQPVHLFSLAGVSNTNLAHETQENNHIVFFKTTTPDLGVPKYRTCKAKKTTRKFGFPKLYSYNGSIVNCKTCGDQHNIHNICGTCYSVLKAETDKIKEEKLGLRRME